MNTISLFISLDCILSLRNTFSIKSGWGLIRYTYTLIRSKFRIKCVSSGSRSFKIFFRDEVIGSLRAAKFGSGHRFNLWNKTFSILILNSFRIISSRSGWNISLFWKSDTFRGRKKACTRISKFRIKVSSLCIKIIYRIIKAYGRIKPLCS